MGSEPYFKNNIVNRITLMDGCAIFFIVLAHELEGTNTPDALFLTKYLAVFGLVLFTFSSGLKMGLNHFDEINDKTFLSNYFIKRFIRLYKAYIGYTLLAFISYFSVLYISTYYLKLNFVDFNEWWNSLNVNDLFNTLIGTNFVSAHLWYLVALLAITSVCFSIIYYFNIKTLFLFIFPLMIFDIIYWDYLMLHSMILFKIVAYMPIYIFGIFCGRYLIDHMNKNIFHGLSMFFIVIFLLSVAYPNNTILKYDILIYGSTFPLTMLFVSSYLLNFNYINQLLLICGKYSFQIYLFHWPLILPILSRLITDVLSINYFIMPYFVTTLAIASCICAYKIVKKIKLNILFE
ncbi:Peptidoglycan/LPS O-acetylase OafA/YrhL, contains acyltransferase and SGNH-hydrolase domains [Methanococcoides vulcani]|uniref:Peptidoglycan/LPS O-acetylase OafA/YrhL, contains acyltransferase and SGNH-hydrolase domains n=1 Tax=Methanococcoides vulcani TaxID=1353158 RepID=A0A1H9Z7W4_9EURY|nr:acyltransferase [Methanococcoides vulcani]SES77561.1 Peptidoglycan/LPS O-acetylase OafA/YrhL, contains acyltransferase and SGNH-hydrolase domains [Methanococcoides vulcani]